VIAGFEPVDVLIAIWMLLKQLREGRGEVENEYTRSVRPEGNLQAQRMMEEVFEPVDKRWRGFPVILKSALELRPESERHDARKRFAINFSKKASADFLKGCRCGEVLRGLIYPQECSMFGKACTPEHPLGPCAVTTEGACNAAMRHKI
jgi:hydrogenase expression/formation protein HypD